MIRPHDDTSIQAGGLLTRIKRRQFFRLAFLGGTLLALGFSRGAVMTSVLVESVVLCVIGGAIGCLLALPVRTFTTGTMSFATFSELAFRFEVTPMMMGAGIFFAAMMGLVGGFFPARRAAMMPITEAVRQA